MTYDIRIQNFTLLPKLPNHTEIAIVQNLAHVCDKIRKLYYSQLARASHQLIHFKVTP